MRKEESGDRDICDEWVEERRRVDTEIFVVSGRRENERGDIDMHRTWEGERKERV